MDIVDETLYNELINVFSGCRTTQDALYFFKLMTLINPECFLLAKQIMLGKKYDYSIINFETIENILSNSAKYKYNDDINYNITKDEIQLSALHRILINKPNKTPSLQLEYIKKECPHCKFVTSALASTTHIVCGYIDKKTGFDSKGCKKDWCFKCEKKLCKQWIDDSLCVESNKIHDFECCKKHAEANNIKYETNYCQCVSPFVNRK
jgi:hypothetical protein